MGQPREDGAGGESRKKSTYENAYNMGAEFRKGTLDIGGNPGEQNINWQNKGSRVSDRSTVSSNANKSGTELKKVCL